MFFLMVLTKLKKIKKKKRKKKNYVQDTAFERLLMNF